MTLYLDASVIVPLVITEAASDIMTAWVRAQTEPLCTGRFAVGEAASAISRRRRMNLLSAEQGDRALVALDDWLRSSVVIVDHEPGDIHGAAMLVRRPTPKLLMPDAIHLATCRRLDLSLVTWDVELASVAAFLSIGWIVPN